MNHQNRPLKSAISPHGGYRRLKSYKATEIIYDGTVVFCKKYVSKFSRTTDQMIQAARSGKQNIAEGSMSSGTSKKTEIRLLSVARSSLEELLQDYEDYVRQHKLCLWNKNQSDSIRIRNLTYSRNCSYATYRHDIEDAPVENAVNTMICLINQANYLLDRQISRLEQMFLQEGGFTENLYKKRRRIRART